MSNVTYEYTEFWECGIESEPPSARYYWPVREGTIEEQLGWDDDAGSEILHRRVIGGWGRFEHYPLGEVYCTGVGGTKQLADVRSEVNKMLMRLWHDHSLDMKVERGVFVDLGDGRVRYWDREEGHGPLGKRVEGVGVFVSDDLGWVIYRGWKGALGHLQKVYETCESINVHRTGGA